MLIQVDGDSMYQVPVGLREEVNIGPTLLGFANALIGPVKLGQSDYLAYDGLIDSALSRNLFDVVFDGREHSETVRPIGAEQSNTSLVYDNRIIVKYFRRLYPGSNPDLEVTSALTDANFPHVAAVLATWQRGDFDLAVAQPYLFDGSDGWNMALLSIRDFLRGEVIGSSSPQGSPNRNVDDVEDPAKAGGNFGNEAHRLGEMTAQLHLALALHFGTSAYDPSTLADSLQSDLDSLEGDEQKSLQLLIEQLRGVEPGTAGKSCRVHGDYHFGQTLRSTSGWYVFDFEGEPARPLTERSVLTSPFKDVAGMLRSLQYAGATGLSEQMPQTQGELASRAEAWEQYNCSKFRQGYFSVDGIDSLIPRDEDTRDLVLRGFEVEKALYELAYEKAYRPDWIAIPATALRRLLG